MSIHHNGRGRSYATCDNCDANVIDLPLDVEASNRIVRTFFRWTRLTGTNRHACPTCATTNSVKPPED